VCREKPRADGGIRTHDLLITNQLLWPTELHRHTKNVNEIDPPKSVRKCMNILITTQKKMFRFSEGKKKAAEAAFSIVY
jgi:hypothetical protein